MQICNCHDDFWERKSFDLARNVSHCLMGLIFLCGHLALFAQQGNIDSLLAFAKKDNEDTNKVNHLNKISEIYWRISSYDSSMAFANAAMELSQHLYPRYKKGIAAALTNMGIVHWYQGDYPKALDYHFRALKTREDIGNRNAIATALGNIANVYGFQGDYSRALYYNFKALKIVEELGNKKVIATISGNIGGMYYEQGKNQKSQAKRDSLFTKALNHYFKALKTDEKLGDKNGIARHLGNIGIIFDEQKDHPKALYYYFKALKMAEELKDKDGIATNLGNISSLYTKQGKYKEAEEYSLKALVLDKEIGSMDGERGEENRLSDIYEKTGRYQLALEHYKNAMVLKDSLFNEEKNKEITRKEMNYEFEKKEAAAKAEQNKKDTLAAEEKRKQNMVIYFISAGLVFLLFFILVIVRGYRQKMQSNSIIALKNEEISRQKANLTGQEIERKRIAQELHDGVGGTLAGIKMNLERINSFGNIPELDSITAGVGDACKEIRTISHHLAPPAISSGSPFAVVMAELIRKFIIPDKLEIHFDCSPPEELNSILQNTQADLYRIVQELLANITKHADAGRVEVSLSKEKNELFLLVEDNGKGFDSAVIRKGIGLTNIESRVKLLRGNMIIDSKANRGTAVSIHIPL